MSIDTIFPCPLTLLKSTDRSRCYLALDLNREITLENFLELEDEEQSENLDLNREITMKDFLEIGDDEQIENLGQDSKLKLDVDQHPTGKDLDTSPKASINRYPPSIDRHSWLNELPSCMIEL